MILKASQRGGGKQLAAHLLRMDENEHVEVHEVRGFVSEDVTGAFKEAHAVSKATRCKQFLFSVSLNPPQDARASTALFEDATERIETAMGLSGQPRVIVFHEKHGRRHVHVVWSRIDAESMTAIPLPFFKQKLRAISKQLYLENDWHMPRGLMDSAAKNPTNFTLGEWQQAKRTGTDARELKQVLQECWAVSDSCAAFAQALDERGMILAKGDRRGHVVVTPDSGTLAIARCVGKKAKEVQAKLGAPDALPTVDEAKARIARNLRRMFTRHAAEIDQTASHDLAQLEAERQDTAERHRAERADLDRAHDARQRQEAQARSARLRSGLSGIWQAVTGQRRAIIARNEVEAQARMARDREERDQLVERQLCERRQLHIEARHQRRAEALDEIRRNSQAMLEDAPEAVF